MWRVIAIVGIIVLAGFVFVFDRSLEQETDTNQTEPVPNLEAASFRWNVEELATELEVPWDMAFLPDGRLLITEREGRVKSLNTDGNVETIAELDQVAAKGESGLFGIAIHPDFESNESLYLAYTYREGGGLKGRVSRFTLSNNKLSDEKPVLDGLPAGSIHDAGRIRFGPDGKLWVPTGDAGQAELAQNSESLAGKVLRLNDDGSVPDDNPTKDYLAYSLGHRNPQGLDWHPQTKALIVVSHGSSAYDEVNLVSPNSNHGWPKFTECNETEGFAKPIACSGRETWAPSGAAFAATGPESLRSSLFVAGLRGQFLKRIEVGEDGTATVRENVLDSKYGRLRAVVNGPDGSLYVSTSNRDGRGVPGLTDDRILKLTPIPIQ